MRASGAALDGRKGRTSRRSHGRGSQTADRCGRSWMKIVSTTLEQAIWAYSAYRFRSQKGNLGYNEVAHPLIRFSDSCLCHLLLFVILFAAFAPWTLEAHCIPGLRSSGSAIHLATHGFCVSGIGRDSQLASLCPSFCILRRTKGLCLALSLPGPSAFWLEPLAELSTGGCVVNAKRSACSMERPLAKHAAP